MLMFNASPGGGGAPEFIEFLMDNGLSPTVVPRALKWLRDLMVRATPRGTIRSRKSRAAKKGLAWCDACETVAIDGVCSSCGATCNVSCSVACNGTTQMNMIEVENEVEEREKPLSLPPLDEQSLRGELDTPEMRANWERHHPAATFAGEVDEFVKWAKRPKKKGRPVDLVAFFRDEWRTNEHTVRRVKKKIAKVEATKHAPAPALVDEPEFGADFAAVAAEFRLPEPETIFLKWRGLMRRKNLRAMRSEEWLAFFRDFCLSERDHIDYERAKSMTDEASHHATSKFALNAIRSYHESLAHDE